MITGYLIDKNGIYTGGTYEQNETEKVKGIITPLIEFDEENECLFWGGLNWKIKPIAFKNSFVLSELKEVIKADLGEKYKSEIDAGLSYNEWTIDLDDDKENKIAKQQTIINNDTVQILVDPNYVRKLTHGLVTDRDKIQRNIIWSDWNNLFVAFSMRLMVLKGTYANLRNQIELAEDLETLEEINIIFPSQE